MAPKPSKTSKSSTSSSSKSLLSVSTYEINWMPSDFKGFLQEFLILPEWHPELSSLGSTALDVPSGKICLYADFFRFSRFWLPISKFCLRMLERYGLHVSQMSPLGFIRLYHYEFVLRSVRAAVVPLYFQIFFKLVKKDDWYSFDKRGGPSIVLKVPSSSHDENWRNKFFFIDEKVIPIRMRWRSPTDPIVDQAPTNNSYKDITAYEWLSKHLTDIQPIPEHALVATGISRLWDSPSSRPVYTTKDGGSGYFFVVLLDNRRGLLVPEERPLKPQEMPFLRFTARYFAFPSDSDATGHEPVRDTEEHVIYPPTIFYLFIFITERF
ncbi:hypothetical protein R6Q59_025174 [Mikania micrantha]